MTSRKTALAPRRLLEVGRAFMASRLLQTAVALDVFSTLAQGPLDVDQLSGGLGLHPRSAHDFLDALVGAGLLGLSSMVAGLQ